MTTPSAKTIAAGLGISTETATRINRLMKAHTVSREPAAETTLDIISEILFGPGEKRSELIRSGGDDDSPSIEFVGMGLDAWAPTILYLDGVTETGRPTGRGRWAVGPWGAIVERGNYD